jgi:hypothetical protein
MATAGGARYNIRQRAGSPERGNPPFISVSSVRNHLKIEDRARERRKWWVIGKYDPFKEEIVHGKTKIF